MSHRTSKTQKRGKNKMKIIWTLLRKLSSHNNSKSLTTRMQWLMTLTWTLKMRRTMMTASRTLKVKT